MGKEALCLVWCCGWNSSQTEQQSKKRKNSIKLQGCKCRLFIKWSDNMPVQKPWGCPKDMSSCLLGLQCSDLPSTVLLYFSGVCEVSSNAIIANLKLITFVTSNQINCIILIEMNAWLNAWPVLKKKKKIKLLGGVDHNVELSFTAVFYWWIYYGCNCVYIKTYMCKYARCTTMCSTTHLQMFVSVL